MCPAWRACGPKGLTTGLGSHQDPQGPHREWGAIPRPSEPSWPSRAGQGTEGWWQVGSEESQETWALPPTPPPQPIPVPSAPTGTAGSCSRHAPGGVAGRYSAEKRKPGAWSSSPGTVDTGGPEPQGQQWQSRARRPTYRLGRPGLEVQGAWGRMLPGALAQPRLQQWPRTSTPACRAAGRHKITRSKHTVCLSENPHAVEPPDAPRQ